MVVVAVVVVGFACAVKVGLASLVVSPLAALFLGVLSIAAIEAAWLGDRVHYGTTGMTEALVARGVAYGTLGVCGLSLVSDNAQGQTLGLLFVTLLAAVTAGWWARRVWHRRRMRAVGVVSAMGLAVALTVLAGSSSSTWILIPLATLLGVPPDRSGADTPLWTLVAEHPQRLLVGTFAALCGFGALLLHLPIAAAEGATISATDALFTAVSAVCVTGLAVVDTARDFSVAGQAMILILIQIGGLGIMTFSTVILRALGQRVSLRHEGAVAGILNHRDRGSLLGVARKLLMLTLVVEGLGTLVLAGAFMAAGEPVSTALWRGLFTSVSAFCNAGFALQSDSLIAYQHSPWILHTVAVVIVIGGIAPIVALLLPTRGRIGLKRLSLQSKIVVTSTAALLGIGLALFASFEWDGVLSGLSLGDRLHNAWFQSVTLRTAGFNSVDLAGVQPETLTVMLVWMIIGGAPGGTAGGIKVTTVVVIGLVVANAIRGRWGAQAFGRRLAPPTIYKALVIIVVAVAGIVLATLCLLLTQAMPASVALFEVVSALGTVGLTLGGTAALDGVGQAVIIACMFIGRVGALSILMLLRDDRPRRELQLPIEDVDIG